MDIVYACDVSLYSFSQLTGQLVPFFFLLNNILLYKLFYKLKGILVASKLCQL